MLLEVIVAALIVGIAAGGRFFRLNELALRGSILIFAALIIQLALPLLAGANLPFAPHLLTVSFGMLLTALLINKMTPAVIFMSTGVFLNLIVIAANSGMPVKATALQAAATDMIHIPLTETTRLPWLADIIPWPLPGAFSGLVSPGDLFLSTGVFLLLFSGMMYEGRRRRGTSLC